MLFLTEQQRVGLRAQRKRERDGRVRDRIKAVLLSDEGWTPQQIAKVLLISDQAVREHVQEYKASEKLKPESGGSQEKLSEEQAKRLMTHLEMHTYLYYRNKAVKYYSSYYYQIDQHSAASGYALRSIGEKREALTLDPFNEEEDGELPSDFPKNEGKDLVKLAFEAVQAAGALAASDYEVTSANLRLRILRNLEVPGGATQSFLSQPIYLGTFDGENPAYHKVLSPFSQKDLDNSGALSAYEGQAYPYTKEGEGYKIPDEGFLAPKASAMQASCLGIGAMFPTMHRQQAPFKNKDCLYMYQAFTIPVLYLLVENFYLQIRYLSVRFAPLKAKTALHLQMALTFV